MISTIENECVTQGGRGANNAVSLAAPDLPCDSQGAGEAVAAPPKPDEMPASAGADEIDLEEIFAYDLAARGLDDDSDPHAFPRSRRLICSTSSDGQTTFHRVGDTGLVLTAEETLQAYEFLANTASVRDDYARAALTGLLAYGYSPRELVIDEAFKIADLALEHRK